jgi:hypothetical protein
VSTPMPEPTRIALERSIQATAEEAREVRDRARVLHAQAREADALAGALEAEVSDLLIALDMDDRARALVGLPQRPRTTDDPR